MAMELAHDICHAVRITHANMAVPAQESVALYWFIQAMAELDLRFQLSVWRPATVREAADIAARWVAVRYPQRGAECPPIAVLQVGPTLPNKSGRMAIGDWEPSLHKVVSIITNERLAGTVPWHMAVMV